ncbi:Tetratricopeptide repeat-containing protein [Singulisphaera sp. GP187]|uniref:tetratricopeptide repeat protein n=1 Tax=Singulisphaera sp. GP187 TaxID=1882752 RepID=UPI00092B4FF6|nr:hypothetical protein [Singulisphaera sp. GP187]SIO09165.1 Tetratricopeptide repeat-containing protein [Singulisphaera sp. GP187]
MLCQRERGHGSWIVLIALSAVNVVVVPASAQDLLGAKGAMQQVRKEAAKSTPAQEAAELRKTIRTLPKKLEMLAPAEAAAAWLAMYDEWQAKPLAVRAEQQQLQFSELFDALPSPEAWPELAALIDARPVAGNDEAQMRALALRMLGHRLTNRTDLLKQDLEHALKFVETPKKPGENENEGGQGAKLGGDFRARDGFDDWRQNLRRELVLVKQEVDPLSAVEQFRLDLVSLDLEQGSSLTVPDLVRLIGPEAATPMLEQALLKNVQLEFRSLRGFDPIEDETVKLARELARKHLKELTHPHWELCQSIDASDLFEAFAAMPKSAGAYSNQVDRSAIAAYVAGLIIRDRPKDLVKYLTESPSKDAGTRSDQIAMSLRSSIVPQLERAGHAQKAHAFLVEALKSHPELPLWDTFIELSARLGQSPEALTILDSALARDTLSPAKRRSLQQVRADALLATDRIEDGVAQSLKLAADDGGNGDSWQGGQSRLGLALRVAEIGRLQERDEWLRQGTDLAEKLLSDESQGGDIADLVGLLIDVGQLARAERLILSDLAKQTAEEKPIVRFQRSRDFGNDSPLEQLLRVYDKAGRAADVVTLLEEAPWWSQTDIGEFLVANSTLHGKHGERPTVPTPLIAARSLVAVGRTDEARRIATAMVTQWPSFDPGWQLALELTGDEFAPLAERVFARDRFEERPLIWLAKFHLDRGNVAKSEALARQAIVIDPSDGEQGRGDRMRAYAVLAEVLRKRGDAKTAAIYEGAVKAIRLAERADQFHQAGMLSRGIRMYRESLTYFADAYCIQSRLAVQLAQSGDLEAASEHYKRAFELMPESFGRVESHCFGCEGVFGGLIAEQIAEQVFMKLVAAEPENPRVHYLLGYLRKSESRDAEAVKSFREAVRLDPDYLNAWQKLLSFADPALTAEERDQATFEVLRLDPFGRHLSADVSRRNESIDIAKVHDLARLWTVLRDQARLVSADPSSPLFELKAAKEALAEAETRLRESGLDEDQFGLEFGARTGLSSHRTLNAIATLIQIAER